MVKTSAAAGAGLWVAPSIFTFDRAAAAVGSCGTKPRRVDFSRWSGSILPSSFTSDDGSVNITFSNADPEDVQDGYWRGRVYPGTINGRDNPVVTGMDDAHEGKGVIFTFTFDTPVALSFTLVDVDRGGGSWEDSVRVIGRLSPSGADIDPTSMSTGWANRQISPNTIRGQHPSSSSNSESEVDFQTPIDTLIITHFDTSNWEDFQWIGVHDFHWC